MRKKYIFGKKLYISILTSILVLLTTVATTFAWVGVFANSTFENFDINIKKSDLDEYGVEISLDGIHFSDEIDFNLIKPQILTNFGYNNVSSMSTTQINKLFNSLNQDQCTTVPVVENNKIVKLGNFTDIVGDETTKFIKFDIYISAVQFYDSNKTSDYNLELFLKKGLLVGNYKTYQLANNFVYPNDFINHYDDLINNGMFSLPEGYSTIKANQIINTAKVNSAAAARIAFEKYEVVDKYHPEQYSDSSTPKSAVIYQDSYDYPVYNEQNDSYEFGSILPDDYNLAIGYYNSTEYLYYLHKLKSVSLPDSVTNTRSVLGTVPDVRLTSDSNQLINPSNPDEHIGVNQMMKVSVYFWFEGWDADCFPVINYSKVNINICFTLKNDEVF